MDDFSARLDDVGVLHDPMPLPMEPVRPDIYVARILRSDDVPPPSHLLDDPQLRLGTGRIDASRYYSREFAELEKQRLWPKIWQFACWANDIPNPGDIHVYRILDRSVLIVRQRDGSVKAFVNACLHRGRELCDQDTRQGELKCPYHFYTWALDGDIKWIPSKWDFPHVDPQSFRLPQVRLEEWNGFLFVNFDDDAPGLAAYMGERFLSQWNGWDFSKRYKAVHVEKRIGCNWKTGQDAFIEGFHAFASHSQGAAIVPDDCGQVDIWEDSPHISRFNIPLGYPSPKLDPQPSPEDVLNYIVAGFMPSALGTPEGEIQPGEDSRTAAGRIMRKAMAERWGVDLTDVPTTQIMDAISYFVFPNFMPWPTLAYPLVYRFRPDGDDPDKCIWDTMLFYPFEGERPPSCEKIVLGPDDPLEDIEELRGLALVLHQDAVQLPLVQRGMKNLASGKLELTEYQELRIRQFHKTLEDKLGL